MYVTITSRTEGLGNKSIEVVPRNVNGMFIITCRHSNDYVITKNVQVCPFLLKVVGTIREKRLAPQ